MESKGRRASRAARASVTAVEAVTPAETSPPTAGPVERTAQEFGPAGAPPEGSVSGLALPEDLVSVGAPPEGRVPAAAAPEDVAVTTAPEPAPRHAALPVAVAARGPSSDDLADLGRETFAALVQSQTAMARGLEALSAEVTGLAISGIDAAARTATDMLGVKTLSDAIEVNAGFTRSSLDTLVGGSAKLSELGVKLAAEASQPILMQLGKSWIKAARLAF
jgi:hypothetical protein